MSTLTIALSEERLHKLERSPGVFKSRRKNWCASVLTNCSHSPKRVFRRALDRVINKNAEHLKAGVLLLGSSVRLTRMLHSG